MKSDNFVESVDLIKTHYSTKSVDLIESADSTKSADFMKLAYFMESADSTKSEIPQNPQILWNRQISRPRWYA